jgi:hypothetical protein
MRGRRSENEGGATFLLPLVLFIREVGGGIFLPTAPYGSSIYKEVLGSIRRWAIYMEVGRRNSKAHFKEYTK